MAVVNRLAEDLKKKAEAKAKLRLENKQKEKAFRDAMNALRLVVCMKRPLLQNMRGMTRSPLIFWRLLRQIILYHPW